jgi:hypothetical protein
LTVPKRSTILLTMKQYIILTVTALTSSIITALLGSVAFVLYVIQPFQKEAVDRGFAIWEVSNNATGATKFQWVEYSALEALANAELPLN